MATSYSEIYNRALIDSYTLTNAINDDPITYHRLMYPYLKGAFGKITEPIEMIDYIKYRKEPDYQIEDLIGDGVKSDFALSFTVDVNSLENIYFIVRLDGAKLLNGVDYTYNQVNNNIHFTVVPILGAKIEVEYYFAGEIVGTPSPELYNVCLTDFAIDIIVGYLVLNWNEKNLNRETLVKTLISPKDYNMFSGANMIKELTNVFKNKEQTILLAQRSLAWKQVYYKRMNPKFNLIAVRTSK